MRKSSRDGMGTITSPGRLPMPPTGAGLAAAPRNASRAHGGLTAPTAGVARGPSRNGAAGRLPLLAGHLHTLVRRDPPPGVVADAWRPGIKQDLQTGTSVQRTNGARGSKDGTMQ